MTWTPNAKQLLAVRWTAHLKVVPASFYRLIFGSLGNSSTQVRQLVEHNLLAVLADPTATGAGRKPLVYAATRAGVALLVGTWPDPPFLTEDFLRDREGRFRTIHTRQVAAFAAAWLEAFGDNLLWASGDAMGHVDLAAGGEVPPNTYLEPDLTLGLAFGNGAPLHAYFVEVDRNTEGRTAWIPKLKRYAWLAAQPDRWPEEWENQFPDLLIPVANESAAAKVAGYVAEVRKDRPLLDSWQVFVGLFDEVSVADRINQPLWQWVRRVAPSPTTPPLDPQRWTLPQIVGLDAPPGVAPATTTPDPQPPTSADTPASAPSPARRPGLDITTIRAQAVAEAARIDAERQAEADRVRAEKLRQQFIQEELDRIEQARIAEAQRQAEEARLAREAEKARLAAIAAAQKAEEDRRRAELDAQRRAEEAEKARLAAVERRRRAAFEARVRAQEWGTKARIRERNRHNWVRAVRAYYRSPRGRLVLALRQWGGFLYLALWALWAINWIRFDPEWPAALAAIPAAGLPAVLPALTHPCLWFEVAGVVVLLRACARWRPALLYFHAFNLPPTTLRHEEMGVGGLPQWVWDGMVDRLAAFVLAPTLLMWATLDELWPLSPSLAGNWLLAAEVGRQIIAGVLLAVAFVLWMAWSAYAVSDHTPAWLRTLVGWLPVPPTWVPQSLRPAN